MNLPFYNLLNRVLNLLRATTTSLVCSATLIVRQPGGVAGTDEGQLLHDGTRFIIRPKDGIVWIEDPSNAGNALAVSFPNNNQVTLESTQSTVNLKGNATRFQNTSGNSLVSLSLSNDRVGMASGQSFGWTASATDGDTTLDTGLKRAAAGVVAVTDGSSGNGTLRVGPGTAAIPSVAFATETNTGLYLTSTNLPSLVIGGYLRTTTNGNGLIAVPSTGGFSWSSTTESNGSTDTHITRLAAGVAGYATTWLQNGSGTKRITADVTNATTTMSNLTDLTVTLIAGRKYVGSLLLLFTNSTTADGFKMDFDGGTATVSSFFSCIEFVQGATPVSGNTASAALATDMTLTALGSTGWVFLRFPISMVCTAATGSGTFIPRVAMNSATTGLLTTVLGSYLVLEDSPN